MIGDLVERERSPAGSSASPATAAQSRSLHPSGDDAVNVPGGAHGQPSSTSAGAAPRRRYGGNSAGRLGPNDPCPCGSGRKVKKCCAKPAAAWS